MDYVRFYQVDTENKPYISSPKSPTISKWVEYSVSVYCTHKENIEGVRTAMLKAVKEVAGVTSTSSIIKS